MKEEYLDGLRAQVAFAMLELRKPAPVTLTENQAAALVDMLREMFYLIEKCAAEKQPDI